VLGLVWDTIWPTHDEQSNRTCRTFERPCSARRRLGQLRELRAVCQPQRQLRPVRCLQLPWVSLCEGALVSALLPFNPFERVSGSKENDECVRVEQRTARAAVAIFCPHEQAAPVGRVPSRGVRGCGITKLSPMPVGNARDESQIVQPSTQGSSVRSAMFIATPAPEAQPSSVGAAWVGCVAVRQGLGESGGGPGHKHAAPTGLGEPCGAVGYKHVAPTGLSGLGGARRLNPKPEGRKKAERRPKPESRSALGFGIRISALGLLSALGFRPSDFKAVRLATNMPPLRGLTDLAVRLAINMSPLRGWSDRAVRLAISFSPLRKGRGPG